VRRVVALCKTYCDYYGCNYKYRTITGPVEPIRFTGTKETTEDTASEKALTLCVLYRQDWVGAAPTCEQEE